MTTEGRFCPTCGTKRTGFFRFCNKCGFDFDELTRPASNVASIVPGQTALPEASPPPAASTLEEPSVLDTVVTVHPEVVTAPPPRSRERTVVRVAIVALAALLGVSAISNALDQGRSRSTDDPQTAVGTPLVGDSPTPVGASASPTPSFGPTGETQFGVVMSVTDGDTIRVDIDGEEYPLRYVGIDAPEPDSTDPTIKAWADAATAANRALVEGRDVFLERDVSETDDSNQLLRNVWLVGPGGDMVLVNLELVRRGFAEAMPVPPDEKYASLLAQAQDSAKTASLGLWAPAASPSAGSSPATVPN